jgi:hypothetical protein
MAKTNKDRVLEYIWSMRPQKITNAQIRAGTGVEPHQQVYMITRELRLKRVIKARQDGREWFFWMDASTEKPAHSEEHIIREPNQERTKRGEKGLTPYDFEKLARSVMSIHFDVPLVAGEIPGVHKEFDLVSADQNIVGDAKYYTLVHGKRLPPAKFATIAEHVWLLEKTKADHRFLVFGNQRAVPAMWLERYGDLVVDIDFYFLSDDGNLELLTYHPK